MSTDQASELGKFLTRLMDKLDRISDETGERVRKLDVAAEAAQLGRDTIIDSYKQNSETLLDEVERLRVAFGKISDGVRKGKNEGQERPRMDSNHSLNSNAILQKENKALEKDKEQLKGNVEELQAQIRRLETEAGDAKTSIENEQHEHLLVKENRDHVSKENTTLKQDIARSKQEAADWKGKFEEKERQYNNEVKTNEVKTIDQKKPEAGAEDPPSHWKGALSFTRAMVSTAVAVAVLTQDQSAMGPENLEDFAKNCTDFVFIIHNLCPDESLRALKDTWPPKWLDPHSENEKKKLAAFCKNLGNSNDSSYMLSDKQPAGKLNKIIEERLGQYTSIEGVGLKIPVPPLLAGDHRDEVARGSQVDHAL